MRPLAIAAKPLFTACLLTALAACGSSARINTGGGADAAPDPADSGPCVPSAEQCTGGNDEDCDGLVDCADPDCSGVGNCPVCGQVSHPLSTPLPLPDGIVGTACTTNADCVVATPNCVEKECHSSYDSTLHFTGFGATQKITDVSNVISVCVNMEHSWLRDLEIQLVAPSGEVVVLQKWLGRMGGEIFLGIANDTDTAANPIPGTGYNYCWTPGATRLPMLDYANMVLMGASTHFDMPAGNYQASSGFTPLVGATLNGDWSIRVTDLWPIDNGFIFEWSVAFDPTLVKDCSGPVIQ